MNSASHFPGHLTIIVPQTPGSLVDRITRAVAPAFSRALGQAVNVENRPGSQGAAGSEYVMRQAPPDGCTILMTSLNNLSSFGVFGKDARLDPLRELTPVAVFAESRLLLGSAPTQPWRTFAEFVSYAKSHPGELRYGASSSSNHLSTEIILGELGLKMTYVPFDSTAVYQQSITAADPHLGLMPELAATGWGEKIRYIAQTGEQRSRSFPEVPTFTELGLPQIKGVRYAFTVRADTPQALIDTLNGAITEAVATEDLRKELAKFLLEVRTQTPAAAHDALVAHARSVTELANRIGV